MCPLTFEIDKWSLKGPEGCPKNKARSCWSAETQQWEQQKTTSISSLCHSELKLQKAQLCDKCREHNYESKGKHSRELFQEVKFVAESRATIVSRGVFGECVWFLEPMFWCTKPSWSNGWMDVGGWSLPPGNQAHCFHVRMLNGEWIIGGNSWHTRGMSFKKVWLRWGGGKNGNTTDVVGLAQPSIGQQVMGMQETDFWAEFKFVLLSSPIRLVGCRRSRWLCQIFDTPRKPSIPDLRVSPPIGIFARLWMDQLTRGLMTTSIKGPCPRVFNWCTKTGS